MNEHDPPLGAPVTEDDAATPAELDFRGHWALLHVVVLTLAHYVTAALAGVTTQADPELVGTMAGYMTLPGLLVGLGMSWLLQRRARVAGLAVGALWCSLLPALLIWGWSTRVMGADERGPLEVAGDSVGHPALGFYFPDPGAGFEPLELPPEATSALVSPMGVWMLQDTMSGEAVVVVAGRTGGGIDDGYFQEVAGGFRSEAAATGAEIPASRPCQPAGVQRSPRRA